MFSLHHVHILCCVYDCTHCKILFVDTNIGIIIKTEIVDVKSNCNDIQTLVGSKNNFHFDKCDFFPSLRLSILTMKFPMHTLERQEFSHFAVQFYCENAKI